MHLFKKTQESPPVDYELLEEIERVKTQIDIADHNFQNAAWKKYRFLLRKAKSMQI